MCTRRVSFIALIVPFLFLTSPAQETGVQLASDTDASRFTVRNLSADSLFSITGDGSVRFGTGLSWDALTGRLGLGTATPAAPLHVSASGTSDGNVLFSGAYTVGAMIPASGAGTRMMWYPRKAAFRAGYVMSTQWDEDSVGNNSFALGYCTKAKGSGAIATGVYTTASGEQSTAMGGSTNASGTFATAMGGGAIASGYASTAMGYLTTASGKYAASMGKGTTAVGEMATAMGCHTTAGGDYSTSLGYYSSAAGAYSMASGYYSIASAETSTAMGRNATASGNFSTAMGCYTSAGGTASTAQGYFTVASGNFSTAMGSFVNTNGMQGSFIIGDYSTASPVVYHFNTAANQMKTRFDGGYMLYSKADTSTGVYMNGGTSGWTNVSDRGRKEHFTMINGEALLAKIRTLPVMEWSYKSTDPSIRYIGPTAQDFWQAFHLGGTDSLGINTICIDGVNLAAVKALERRTAEWQEAMAWNDRLLAEVRRLNGENKQITGRIVQLEHAVRRMEAALERCGNTHQRARTVSLGGKEER